MKQIITLLAVLIAPLIGRAQLVGFYNIGGDFASYDNLTEAFDDLMAQGADGDITFLLHPGTYTGQASLGTIPGNPGVITVKSASNNAADAILAFDAAFPLPNHIVRLDGSNNVKFEDVTFHALNTDRARCIHFTGNTDNLKLWDCVFIGSASTSTNSYFERVLVWCNQNELNNADNPDYLQVLNCEFRNGYQAIEIDAEGNSGARALGMMIAENTMTDQLGLGITVNNGTGEIAMNRISTSVGNGYVGIRTNYFDNGSKIQRNTIQAHSTQYSCTGIETGNTQFTTGNQVHNNMITVSANGGEVLGMGVSNLWDMSIVWNTVAVTGGGATSRAFFHQSNFADGQDCMIRNNIFVNHTGGVALESTVADNIVAEDHNDLFSSGPVLARTGGTDYADLAAYQTGTGDGAADVSIDPAFPSLPDLHVNSCALDGSGEWFPIGLGDIDYQQRGNPVCDIGADEFTFTTTYIAPTVLVDEADLPYTLSAPDGTNYQWNTGSTAPTQLVQQSGTFFCEFTDVNGCAYSIQWQVNVNFSTGVATMVNAYVQLWPNPVIEHLTVTGLKRNEAYFIVGMNGDVVSHGRLQNGTPIDVRHVAPGLYTLRTSSASVRFVKQ